MFFIINSIFISIFISFALINLNLLVITSSLIVYLKTTFISIEFLLFIISIILISIRIFWKHSK